MSPNPRKDVPAYALAIRELREKTGLTQPQLAAELGVKRVSVARWEGCAFEPSPANYLSLYKAAKRHNLPDLVKLFHSNWSERERREHEAQEAEENKRYFLRIKKQAEAGDDDAKKIVALSRMGRVLNDLHAQKTQELIRSLSGEALSKELEKLGLEWSAIRVFASGEHAFGQEMHEITCPA
jgi:transcriptional regulator with XRE-family HTH domain